MDGGKLKNKKSETDVVRTQNSIAEMEELGYTKEQCDEKFSSLYCNDQSYDFGCWYSIESDAEKELLRDKVCPLRDCRLGGPLLCIVFCRFGVLLYLIFAVML